MVKYGGGKILSREPKPDIDESLCLPTTRESKKATNHAVTLARIAYHANPSSKQYRCTQYVIYDSLAEKKPHIRNSDSVCSMPSNWLMDCASNFAILDLQWVILVNLSSASWCTWYAASLCTIGAYLFNVPSMPNFKRFSHSQHIRNNFNQHLRFEDFFERLVISLCYDFISMSNKSFNKRKNRALLTLRRSQKHYEIFSNNVFRKNITRKRLRLETIEIAWFRVGLVPGL